jgi:hypothetical protein
MQLLNLREQSKQCMPKLEVKEHLRKAAINTWSGRMVNEHGSARVFEGLSKQLEVIGISDHDLNRVKSFAVEERNHGVLCGAVVEALGGKAIAPALEVIPFPKHEDVEVLEAAIRNLLSISCLSETIAVALIGAEREEMPEGELRELLTKIWAEECGHANFGWRLLPTLLQKGDQDLPRRLGEYLVVAFAHLEQHELSHLPLNANPPPEGATLGLCSGKAARALFYATVEGIIIPGLESHGLPAKEAWNRRAEAGQVIA